MASALRAAESLKEGQRCVMILADSIRNYMTKFLDNNWLMDRDIIKVYNDYIILYFICIYIFLNIDYATC